MQNRRQASIKASSQMNRLTILRNMLDEVFCPLNMIARSTTTTKRKKNSNSKPEVRPEIKGNEMDVDIKAALIHVPTLRELLTEDDSPQDSDEYHELEEVDDDDSNHHAPTFLTP